MLKFRATNQKKEKKEKYTKLKKLRAEKIRALNELSALIFHFRVAVSHVNNSVYRQVCELRKVPRSRI